MKKVRLERVLSTTGQCTRQHVKAFLRRNEVRLRSTNGRLTANQSSALVCPGDVVLNGQPLDIAVHHVILFKPAAYVCSTEPGEHKSIYHLFPEHLLTLKHPLRTAGRLDKWVTGLVFMTQDGELAHRVTSPKSKSKCPKTYLIKARDSFKGTEQEKFGSGELMLRSEGKPLLPAEWRVVDERRKLAEMTIYEGRYHQVRRMLASVGNKAVEIQRRKIGPLTLGNMKESQWRRLSSTEVTQLYDFVGIPENQRPMSVFHLSTSNGTANAVRSLVEE